MKTKLCQTVDIGTHVLKEYDIIIKGESIDSICKVFRKGRRGSAIYCSIPDALAHRGEWDENFGDSRCLTASKS